MKDKRWLFVLPLLFLILQLIVLEKFGPFLSEGWFSDIAYHLNMQFTGWMAKDIPYGGGWSTGIGKVYFLVHFVFYKVFGVGLFQARLVTVVSGVILLILLYRWTKKHISKDVAVFSTFLLASSPLFCVSISSARHDVMLCLFAFLSFCFISSTVLGGNIIYCFFAGLFSAMSVDVSYRGVEVVMAVYIFHCVFFTRETFLRRSILLLSGSFIAFVSWIILNVLPIGLENFILYQLSSATSDAGVYSIHTILSEFTRFLSLSAGPARYFLVIEIVCLVALSIIFYRCRLRYQAVSRVLFSWLVIIFFVMSIVENSTYRTYLLMYYPILCIFAGIGLCELFKQKREFAYLILAMIILLVSSFQVSRFAFVSYHRYVKRDSDIKGYFEKLRSSVDLSKAIMGSTEYWYAFPDAQFYGGQFYLSRVNGILKELKDADEYASDFDRTNALLKVFEKRKIEYIIADEHFKPSIICYFPNQEFPSKNFLLMNTFTDGFLGKGAPPLHGPPYKTEIYKIISYDP